MSNEVVLHDDNMYSALEEALGTLSADDYKEILGKIDPVSWIQFNRILKGEPFSFEGRDYLLQPYRDDSQNLIFYKGRQVEMSEFSMNWLLEKLHRHPYTSGLHTFPRDNQCLKFSKQRLDSAIRDSERIKEWYDERNSEIKMRKFTDKSQTPQPFNFYIMGGTWESKKDTVGDAARGISIDFIVYDERQDHPDDVETVVGEAASHSAYKQTLTLGTPKLPGTQFDQQWESSDKHYWFVTCNECGRKEPLTMDNILWNEETEEWYYGCPRCRNPIDRLNGEWIATNPQKRPLYRGYHISQLMVCWLTADEIKRKEMTYPKRRFYNEVLGLAYGGDDIPITWTMMRECTKNNRSLGVVEGNEVYVGIDWGSSSYCYIQEKVGFRAHKMVDIAVVDDKDPRKHPKNIARMIKKYGNSVRRVVCDAGPDITRFHALREELKKLNVHCEVWACYYAAPPAKTSATWNNKENHVTAGRSEFIESVIDEIHDGRFIIPGEDASKEVVETFMEHCTNISAERQKTASGIEFIQYGDTGPDHFLHAKVYANIASSASGGISVGSVAPQFKPSREINLGAEPKSPKKTNKSGGKFPVFNRKRRK